MATDKMIVIELFSGSCWIAQAFRDRGHQVLTIDNNEKLSPDLCADISSLSIGDIPIEFRKPDIIWASPPCQKFSVAVCYKNWRNGKPINQETLNAIELVKKTLKLIGELNPKYFFIENPRGMLRTLDIMKHLSRYTITYCQYGDTRQKPTDIWTNYNNPGFRKPCATNSSCHKSARRGSKTGTQGLNGAYARGIIPAEFCKYVVDISEKQDSLKQLRLK